MIFRAVAVFCFMFAGIKAWAEPGAIIETVMEDHVLPGYTALNARAAILETIARSDCSPSSAALRTAYHDAFDAWSAISHVRFGPAEQNNRYFSLAFWPDDRGAIQKTLRKMIAAEDPAVNSTTAFATVSVAARGFYALDQLLYNSEFVQSQNTGYICQLVRCVVNDIVLTSQDILRSWNSEHATLVLNPGENNPVYFDQNEVLQQFYKTVLSELEFTSETRLGRPLGTFERPRPKRAEAWRSERSLRNITISMNAVQNLTGILASDLSEKDQLMLTKTFERIEEQSKQLNDPVFAGVSDPQGRLKVEILQQSVRESSDSVKAILGPALGVSAGFNSLDGD